MSAGAVRCLPLEVQGRLRSGVALPGLQQCVEELLLNSLDAGCSCVGVRLDMEALKVQVIDNGAGISPEDMECLGRRYHTSKCSSVEDLDNLRWFGFRGEALASIVSLATLVEISSKTRSSVKTHVKIFKDGQGMNVFEAETSRPSAGTTVVVCNFFHNMPVRRRRVDPVLEGERIRHRVEAVSLMHPSVSFTLKNDCTGAMIVQLPKARNTYHRFVQIHGLSRAQRLGEISFRHRQFEVVGHLGKEGHYNNSLQFLYVNGRLLLKTRIHKLLNALLRRLSSTNSKHDSPDGTSAIRSPKLKRSQEMYGVFIINIKCPYSEYDICLEPVKTLIEFRDWDGVLVCIEGAVKAFMSRENLVALVSQEDLEDATPKVYDSEKRDPEERDEGDPAALDLQTLDCTIGTKLSSESVHRSRTNDCEHGDAACQQSGLTESKTNEREQPGHKIISANDLGNTGIGTCISKECREETQRSPAPVHSDSYNDNNKDIEMTVSEAGKESISYNPGESQDALSSQTESNSHCAASASYFKSDLCRTEERAPNRHCSGRHGHTLPGVRKISLSDPYIHESLQTSESSQSNKPRFQKIILPTNYTDKSFASKRKISLEAQHRFQTSHRDFTSIVPMKIPRRVSCQKLSTYTDCGSLDKFRRIFDQQCEPKLSHCKSRQTDIFNLTSESVCKKDQHQEAVTEEEVRGGSTHQPTLKMSSERPAGKTSLAAKLCHLKQRTHQSESLDMSTTTTQDPVCLRSEDVQDYDKNKDLCDQVLKPEPTSSCSTNAPPAEESTALRDWVQHYDTSVGKTVYVNRVTGLSTYNEPSAEETQVLCTSDVTNLAVSVISDSGMEYRCYPFQMDVVLPFLPKPRPDRVFSSGPDGADDVTDGPDSLSSLYSKWNNPVFVRPPEVAVDISSGQADGLVVKIHNILFPYRFSKAMIHSMKVINQVDKKFVACLINTHGENSSHGGTEGNLLVLVDQHAAHERVRLEDLVADSYEDNPDVTGERRLRSSNIVPPLQISITEDELRLLRSCQFHLRSLGLEVTFPPAAEPQVLVGKAPLCFMEKESNEQRRGRPSVIKAIVEEYLQEQIELRHSTGRVRGTLPLTLLKVLASLACHGAVKFNTALRREECQDLIASLSSCQLPFQCAHGRPSIVPLVDTLYLDREQKELQKPNLQKLRRMYKAWLLYGNT